MKQKRNLLINTIMNIIGFSILYYLIIPPNFKKDPAFSVVFLILVSTLVGFLNVMFSILFANNDAKNDKIYICPPTGFFVQLYFYYCYLKGRVKPLRSNSYLYFARYTETHIIIYLFKPFYMARIGKYSFDCTDPDHIRRLDNTVARLHEELVKSTRMDAFKKWDGTLNPEAKRINTIDNIIK